MILLKSNLLVSVFILLLLLPFTTMAQQFITGTVISETTGLPVEGASVYFNNTSIGTSANAAGKFSLQLPGLQNAELIISGVGYELLVYNLPATIDLHKTYLFKLAQKEQQLRDVLILPDALRRKYLSIFEENFLGITEEASRSSIQNRKDIYFTSGDDNHTIRAYSDTPLVIVNKMLGYKIKFELVDFSFNKEDGRTFYYGYTRFEEMGDKARWQKSRRQCYYGSTAHFYRSLIANRLKEEAFKIYLVKPVRLSNDTTVAVSAGANKASGREEMAMAVSITPGQIIQPDTNNINNYLLAFKGKLMVQYDKEPRSKWYLKKNTFLQGNMPVGFRSYVTIKSGSLQITSTGIVNNPMDVEYSGFWIYEKAANMLPFNYEPD
jgi:CarboxypepD_reg-like domain